MQRNVELPLGRRGIQRGERRRTALAALERVGVAHLAERQAAALSDGEAQCVNLARALAIEPDLLLLDQPAAGLDPEARHRFLDDLEAALADRSVTVVHVSHRAHEALRMADRVAILSDGMLRQLGTPSSVVRQPADAAVARLVGYDNVIPVETDQPGDVLIAGVRCGLPTRHPCRPGTLATWGAAIRIAPLDRGPLQAGIERVSPGPGHWEVVLSAGATLRAHLPLNDAPPQANELVSVSITGHTPPSSADQCSTAPHPWLARMPDRRRPRHARAQTQPKSARPSSQSRDSSSGGAEDAVARRENRLGWLPPESRTSRVRSKAASSQLAQRSPRRVPVAS